MAERNAHTDLERAEDYLLNEVLPYREAWPPHYRDADDAFGILCDKFLEADQVDELNGAVGDLAGAGDGFNLRVGFELGRRFAAHGEISRADVCRAVLDAGGDPGRALAEVVAEHLREMAVADERVGEGAAA